MIMNELQTMPYYFCDEIASKPYNRNWNNLLLIGLYFTAGSNQTSRLDIKIDKYILFFLFLFQSSIWQSNYTLNNFSQEYDDEDDTSPKLHIWPQNIGIVLIAFGFVTVILGKFSFTLLCCK
jgi:hypothetical protein